MKIYAYLYVSQSGGVRLTKTAQTPKPNEMAVGLHLDIPDSFFKRPIPMVEIPVPDTFVVPNAEVVAKVIAPEVANALKISIGQVEDGLLAMLTAPEEL